MELQIQILRLSLLVVTLLLFLQSQGQEAGSAANCTDQFKCADGQCIPTTWLCDEDYDCADHSDELNCTKRECPADQFQCGNGRCVPKRWRCDDKVDCSDYSDEINCNKTGKTD